MAQDHHMIEPFEPQQVRAGVVSYGVSSYGYDMRLADEFQLLRLPQGPVLDPKQVAADDFERVRSRVFTLAAGSYCLGRSLEYFRIPRNVLTLATGKSTYARAGVFVNVTPFEPEWEGFVTIAIFNTGRSAVNLYAGEGIAQVIFFLCQDVCRASYADRKGKYQASGQVTASRI